jgi:hypothetical protein
MRKINPSQRLQLPHAALQNPAPTPTPSRSCPTADFHEIIAPCFVVATLRCKAEKGAALEPYFDEVSAPDRGEAIHARFRSDVGNETRNLTQWPEAPCN